jgi:membrane-bound metal-dependent hydrolase YbcI (DUF457 family)
MTPVGHSLTGATLFFIFRQYPAGRTQPLAILAFIICANIPDLRIPYWGHHRYFVSHSIFVTLAAILILAILLAMVKAACAKMPHPRILLGCALAWVSHLLLDSFYNHARGIAIFWPFSNARLSLPIPCFSTLQASPPPLNAHTLKVFAIELAVYVPILMLVAIAKKAFASKDTLNT